jgi:diguanylate cyclase (GGDEF)-like protein
MMIKLFRSHSTGGNRRTKPILSIRARLVVLALLAVVPLMLDRVRLLESSRSERIDEVGAEVLDLTRRGTDGQREIITTVRAMLQMTARAYITMMARGETCNFYLKDLTGNVPWIKGVSIIGPDGRIKCATLANAEGLDLSDRPHYREALRTKDFVVSDYLIGRVTRTPALVVAYPAQAIDETVNAVVVASVDLQWVSGLISALERRPGSTVMLIDGNNTLLAGDPSVNKWTGKSVRDSSLVNAIGDRSEGTVRAEGLDGVRRIFGFVQVPSSDARLLVGLNETEALRRVDREILVAYLQVGFFGLLVLMIAWFGGERLIVDPIRSLARTAMRLGRGDLDARADQQAWAKEFEPLATALNDMAQKLADREKELRAANRHLEQLASVDSLSGLANRRGFDERIATVWQRAGKLGRSVALLMIDVDHFKLFNDRYGHVEGDVCLRRVGKLLMDFTREADDLPARYGGEEFALLLPGADVERALEVAERLRRAVEALCVTHADSPLGQVTISIGVAAMVPLPGQDAETMVEAADAGLYAAKRRGRNTVVVHSAVVLTTEPMQGNLPLTRELSDASSR